MDIATMSIEFLENLIDDLQKRIRLNYLSLQDENMPEVDRERITDEVSQYRNMIASYQSALRQKYQGIFKATYKRPERQPA